MNRLITAWILLVLTASGCAAVKPDITGNVGQAQIRQIQTRHYQTQDQKMTLRSVIATLQDLGFVIDNAELDLGTVTAARHWGTPMRITVTVRQKDAEKTSVRANAHSGETRIDDPQTYQDFFVVLDKSMFLTLNQID
jgi:hypothetical protein